MTDQVQNVTETEKKELSVDEEFDLEWDEEEQPDQRSDKDDSTDDPADADRSASGDHGKAEEGGAETTGTVAGDSSSSTSEDDQGARSAGKNESDIWADANEAQLAELKKLRDDLSAMTGRTQAEQRRKAALEKELEKVQADLRQATRTKGQYEQEHPELFAEVETYLKDSGYTKPSADSSTENPDEGLSDDDVEKVFKIHPDVGDLMRADAWSEFVDGLDDEGKAKFNSSDPYEFADLVTEFKFQQRLAKVTPPSAAPAEDPTVVHTSGSSSKPAPASLSVDEDFDLEWDRDD